MGGYFRKLKIVVWLKLIAMRIWTYSGLSLFTFFILYYIYGGLLPFLLLIFAVTGILYHSQDQILYHPDLPSHSRVFVPIPSMHNLSFENVYTRSEDGTLLHMYFIKQPEEQRKKCPTIIFFHGNAGNIGHRLQNALGLYTNLRCNLLTVEYRGYGLSEGSPSEEGLYMDARCAINYLGSRSDVDHSEIIVFGRSLGGAVAIDLAARPEYAEKIWCLVLENTFTGLPEMAKVVLSWRMLQYLPLFFYKNKFLSLKKITRVHLPVLFISGLADTLVPPRMMFELYTSCGSSVKQLLQIPSGTHNDTWTVPGYYHAFAVFLQSCRIQRPPNVRPMDEFATNNKIHNV